MIKTHVADRATGKTTEVITRLKENSRLVALVPSKTMAGLYPDELQDRVFTFTQLGNGWLRGRKFEKILIDEGYCMTKDAVARFYYHLGQAGFDTEVYGTIE